MSVYVIAQGKESPYPYFLLADTTEELHEFAEALGLPVATTTPQGHTIHAYDLTDEQAHDALWRIFLNTFRIRKDNLSAAL